MDINLSPDDIRPLIEAVVTDVLIRLNAARLADDGRMAYSEPEAAAMLGMNPHQLRYERLCGRLSGSVVAGKRVRYLKSDLLNYLMRRRVNEKV